MLAQRATASPAWAGFARLPARPLRGSRGLALVSGGSGDIGAAICRALHADGWGLAIGYVTRDRAESLAAEPAAHRAAARGGRRGGHVATASAVMLGVMAAKP